MENYRDETKQPAISDEAVRAKTGKGWDEWFALIDAAGGQEKSHQEIVAYLAQYHQVAGWWQQTVTNTYEQARGKRARHQMPDGYQISRSKTFSAPVAALYQAWSDPNVRERWLDQPDLEVRKATPDKSMRINWPGEESNVDVYFYPKGGGKSQVTVQHNRLAGADEAERMKAYWGEALDRLKHAVESA